MGSSDLDIVFYLPSSYDTVEKLERDRENILDDIVKTLNRFEYKIVGRSTKALQIQTQRRESGTGDLYTIDIDLLPILNLDKYSPKKVIDMMCATDLEADLRKFFTPSLTKLQRDFIKSNCPEHLKRLIRFVKHWKNKMKLKEKPSSYAMELLIVHLWREGGKPNSFKFDNALGCLMEALVSYKDLRVEFDEYYGESRRQIHTPPYIIDPVNPFSNVLANYDHWQKVADKAKNYLQSNLSNLTPTGFFDD